MRWYRSRGGANRGIWAGEGGTAGAFRRPRRGEDWRRPPRGVPLHRAVPGGAERLLPALCGHRRAAAELPPRCAPGALNPAAIFRV